MIAALASMLDVQAELGLLLKVTPDCAGIKQIGSQVEVK